MVNPRVTLTTATSRGLVLDLIRSRGPISRIELAESTGLTQATMSNVVKQLLVDDLVVESGRRESTGGKPRVLLSLNPTARFAIGVQLGADALIFVVTDLRGAVVGRSRTRGVQDVTPEHATELIADRISLLLDSLGIEPGRVVGIGLVTPGPLDLDAGTLLGPPTLGSWAGFPLRSAVQARTRMPVVLDNDATAAAIGDFWGGGVAGAAAHCTVYVGAGIGAGIVLGGTVYRGASSNTGELGQMRVIRGPGHPSASVEELAGPHGVVERARAQIDAGRSCEFTLSPGGDTFAEFSAIANAAVHGDPFAVELITESAHYLADAVISLANVLDLDSIVLAGPALGSAGWIYLSVLENRIGAEFFARQRHGIAVQLSEHVTDAAAVGGAALVLQQELAPRTLGLMPQVMTGA